MKKIIILNGSYNLNGNTSTSIQHFLKGLKEEIEVEEKIVNAPRMNPNPCRGCLACRKKDDIFCVQQDETFELVKEIVQADIVVFAFPIYYYYMPGSLKILLDRHR